MTNDAQTDYDASMPTESPKNPMIVCALPRRTAAVLLMALGCAALTSACGSSSSSSTSSGGTVDTARVARAIEGSVLTRRHIHATVVCPAAVAIETGKTFECVATSRSTTKPFAAIKTPFVVTIQNSKGYVTYVGK